MSYKLVIAEKPSVAQSIAKVIGADKREDGYLEGNGYIVSWCVGHLVELASPESYDEKYEKWRYDDLYQAALCRERADWIVGMNETRLFSTLYGQTLNVGRVMTPTLAMIVQREVEIEGFKPEPIYRLSISCGGITAVSDRFESKRDAEKILNRLKEEKTAQVTKIDPADKQEKAPQLYSLTALQRDANRYLGFTAQQTLDYTQSLYEKKLVTYPRTDSTDSEEENEDKRGNGEMLACIAAMTNGKSYPLQNTKIEEGKTTPKKHFTEDSLLSAMERAGTDEMPEETERKGIGTSATRAATIEKLVRIGFVERKGNKKTKYLMPTYKGVALITVMPEQIQSPSMTPEWEQKLLDVEKGNFQDTEFMSEIEEMITDLVKTYKVIEDAEVLMHPAMEEIGICPCCGQHVIERQKGYSCENRGCNFVLWKQNRFFEALGKKMTKQTAIKLLTDGKVALKGCKSKKTGNTYDTTVIMTVDENQRAVFKLNFEKGAGKYGKSKNKKD